MNISMSKTREQFPLSTRKIVKKTIAGLLFWVFALSIIYTLIMIGLSVDEAPFVWPLRSVVTALFIFLIVGVFTATYFYQRWYFAVYFYDLTQDYIIIKKGPITPLEITIPYERVQDVYVDQDLLDRFMGLYDVHLSSATISSGMEAHIDGVEKPAADGLRALLLQTVSERISKKVPAPPAAL